MEINCHYSLFFSVPIFFATDYLCHSRESPLLASCTTVCIKKPVLAT